VLLALRIFAVAVRVMVTGAGPQLKVMTPPAATAATNVAEVQDAAVPVPTTRVGWDVSTARASAGTVACPLGLPFAAGTTAGALGDAPAAPGDGVAEDGAAGLGEFAGRRHAALAAAPPHPASRQQASTPAATAAMREEATAHRLRCPTWFSKPPVTVTSWAGTAVAGAAA
jgi:hypothetical protein